MNPSLETKTVLVVEDDDATRALVARRLRRCGMQVTEASSAEDVPMETAFDVVVSDVHLPGMTGLDLATALLEQHPGQPIVLMTGDPDEALSRDALSRGPVGFLLKPFALESLESAVEQTVALQAPAPTSLPEAESPGRVPLEWLDVVDERSYAGKGHARRVARIAMALVESARAVEARLQVGDLVVAAWSHELGRLMGEESDPVKLAVAGARRLAELQCSVGVVDGVRHMH